MQPTTHQMISGMTITGVQDGARHGLSTGRSSAGLRTRAIYGFLILALCLMIADFCRLTRTPTAEPVTPASSGYQSTRL
jgi:hypothetical protein